MTLFLGVMRAGTEDDDALPTPQKAQMWAQVGKQRKKEELEHAP
jgi:hypothetical protein